MVQPNSSLTINISKNAGLAHVELFTGPNGPEHFGQVADDYGHIFCPAGWIAIEASEDPEVTKLIFPWKGEKNVSLTHIRSGENRQSVLYIMGVDPDGITFEQQGTSMSVNHTTGTFLRPLGQHVGKEEASKFLEYSHRHEINPGFFGRVLVYSALDPISLNPFTKRQLSSQT